MIIDAHVHLGEDVVFDEVNTEEELIKYYDEFDIDGGIIQPFIPRPYLEDHRKIHDRIAKFCKEQWPRKNFLEWLPSIRISIQKIIMMKQNAA